MGTILRYEAPGGDVLIEVADEAARAPSGYSSKGAGLDPKRGLFDAGERLESALTSLKATANAFANVMKSVDVQPDEATVEIALKFTAEAGVIIARTAGEAQLRVAMTWSPRSAEKNG